MSDVKQISPFGLRMQPELKDEVQAAAIRNNRSMNAEIVNRLELTLALEKNDYGPAEVSGGQFEIMLEHMHKEYRDRFNELHAEMMTKFQALASSYYGDEQKR